MKRIEIRMTAGDFQFITAHAVLGDFAIHRPIFRDLETRKARPTTDGDFVVTYIPLGSVVGPHFRFCCVQRASAFVNMIYSIPGWDRVKIVPSTGLLGEVNIVDAPDDLSRQVSSAYYHLQALPCNHETKTRPVERKVAHKKGKVRAARKARSQKPVRKTSATKRRRPVQKR